MRSSEVSGAEGEEYSRIIFCNDAETHTHRMCTVTQRGGGEVNEGDGERTQEKSSEEVDVQ